MRSFSGPSPPSRHLPGSRGTGFGSNGFRSSNYRPDTAAHTLTSMKTADWPFHSVRGSEMSTNPLGMSSMFRPSSSMFRPNMGGPHRPASSVLDADIVPDYVINFMRGETPESLARKRERQRGAQTPQFGGRGLHHRSMTADIFYGDVQENWQQGDEKDVMMMEECFQPWSWKMMTAGWRGGLVINFAITIAALTAAAVCLGLAAKQARVFGGQLDIMEGQCSTVRGVNYGISLAVNVMGFIVLAGANYAFQVLSSPTRPELDLAHRQLSWMDIGIPSLRNLVFINGIRAFLAVLIVVLGVASQVIYNSLVFVSTNNDMCTLVLNNTMLFAIVVLNALFILAIGLAMGRPTLDPIVTIGDAISSFLVQPDPTTRGVCLLEAHEVETRHQHEFQAKCWVSQSHRWMQAPSVLRWSMGWLFFWIMGAGLAVAVMVKTLGDEREKAFGQFGQANTAYPFSTGRPGNATAFLLALPQVAFSLLYLATNAFVTMFFLSHEFSQFAIPGTLLPLRVSNGHPEGSQVSSLYLTLPRVYSCVLFFLFVVTGFLVSQSMFLVSVGGKDATGAAIGISTLPLAILLGVLVIVAAFVLGLSLRSTNPTASIGPHGDHGGNPLALKGGPNSVVISARCQRSPMEKEDMVTRPIGWGVVRMPIDWSARHAAFSNNPQGVVRVGMSYA